MIPAFLIFDGSQWVSVVTAGITVIALAAFARLVSSKANKAEVDKELETLRADGKHEAEESLRQYRELQTSIEVLKDRIVALDKNSLTKGDLVEMKGDIKDLVKGTAETVKLIDGIPDRLTSLEATRNKQSEK